MLEADELRRAIEAAPRNTLPAVTALLWRAFGEGKVSEAEAEALSALIEARRSSGSRPSAGQSPNPRGTGPGTVTEAAPVAAASIVRRWGSRPRTDASMERRRRWAASGRLPPQLAAKFTLAEQAVLALVAAETARAGDCRLAVPHIAAVAGVSETTVRNAIREARGLGLLTVEERRLTGFRNDTNVVRIISPEWMAWMRLARRETRPVVEGGGCNFANRTTTEVLESGKTRLAEPSKGCRKAERGVPFRSDLDSARLQGLWRATAGRGGRP